MQCYRSAVAISLLFTCVCCAKNTKITLPTVKTTLKTNLPPTLNRTMNTILKPCLEPSKMPAPIRWMSPMLMRFIPTVHNDTRIHTRMNMSRHADSQEVPYIVALEFMGKNSSWFCAGTILDHRWIVTVASCTQHAVRVKISYGATQRSSAVRVVYVGKRSMFPHPKYDNDYANDIALIHMPYVKFSKHIGPVPIGHGLTFALRWIYTSGWGQHRDTKKDMNQLHLKRIQLMPTKYCVNQGYGRRFRSSMLCARLRHVDTSCSLDSGSPLVMQSKCGLIGIASFGSSENCRNNTLLSYTRLNAYREWIDSVMHKK